MSIVLVEAHDLIDAHHISSGVWQGSVPAHGTTLRDAGFTMLVLCAMEHQPSADNFPGIEVIHAPNDDDDSRRPTSNELRIAIDASQHVLRALQAERQVLVTCWAGLNRSGLVSALALRKHLGISGSSAIKVVQMMRPKALTNRMFQACLSRLPVPEPKL